MKYLIWNPSPMIKLEKFFNDKELGMFTFEGKLEAIYKAMNENALFCGNMGYLLRHLIKVKHKTARKVAEDLLFKLYLDSKFNQITYGFGRYLKEYDDIWDKIKNRLTILFERAVFKLYP